MGAAMKKLLLSFLLLFLFLLPVEAANRFGVCTVTCTWDASSTAMWSTTTGGGTGASAPGASDAVIFDGATCVGGVTCTITVNTTVASQSIAMGACTASTTGCILDFSANNNNVTLSTAFTSTGTGTRTLNMGNGTWTLSGVSGNVWDVSTATNFTFNSNGSTIVFNNTTSNTNVIFGAGLNYNAITFSSNSGRGGYVLTTAVGTMGAVTFQAPSTIFLAAAVTFPATSLVTSGGSISNLVMISSNSTQNATTISDTAGTNTLDFVALRRITASGGATFNATNSIDLGGNTGITFV